MGTTVLDWNTYIYKLQLTQKTKSQEDGEKYQRGSLADMIQEEEIPQRDGNCEKDETVNKHHGEFPDEKRGEETTQYGKYRGSRPKRSPGKSFYQPKPQKKQKLFQETDSVFPLQ